MGIVRSAIRFLLGVDAFGGWRGYATVLAMWGALLIFVLVDIRLGLRVAVPIRLALGYVILGTAGYYLGGEGLSLRGKRGAQPYRYWMVGGWGGASVPSVLLFLDVRAAGLMLAMLGGFAVFLLGARLRPRRGTHVDGETIGGGRVGR